MPGEQQKPLERLVERILSAKQRDAGADVSTLERELDELVYALYGLTPGRKSPRPSRGQMNPRSSASISG